MLPIVQRRFLCLDAGRLPPGTSNILKAQNRAEDPSIMATQGDIVDILQHAYIALCVCVMQRGTARFPCFAAPGQRREQPQGQCRGVCFLFSSLWS